MMLHRAPRFSSQIWRLRTPSLCRTFAAISTYKAVIFDMYGVLIPSPVKLITVFEQQNSIPPGTVGQAIRTGGEVNAWKRYMRGELGAEEFVKAFGMQCSEIAGRPVPIGLFLSNLASGPMTRPLPIMVEAIQCLRSHGLKTAVLSNNFLQLNGKPFLPLDNSLFDVIVESCREGLSKPDPRIFHLCLDRLGVSAPEAVFLDDLEFNIKAAAQLGMHGIKVEDPILAVKALEEVLRIPLSESVSPLPMDQLTKYLKIHNYQDQVSLGPLSPGQSNTLYHLTSGGRHLLLSKKQKGLQVMETESRLLKALRGCGLPVPEIIDLCEDTSVLGSPFLLMEVSSGRRFSDPSLPGVDPGHRRAMYRAMTQTLCQIHQVDITAVGLEDYGKLDDLSDQVERWTQQYKDSGAHPIPAMERLIRWLPLHLPKNQRSTLVHGNFRLENLVFHAERPEVVGVMDWGGCSLGNPLSDLISGCLAHCLPPDIPRLTGMSDRALDQLGIPSVEEVIGQYCSTIGLGKGVPDWQFYMAFHMFCLATTACHQGDNKNTISGQTISGRLADLAWDFATKEGFRIFNAIPRGPHSQQFNS